MATIHYIDPILNSAIKDVPESVQREVDHTFDIAHRIHEILVRKNWNQADLANAMHKKESLISLWLSGRHNFTIRTISEIETVLGEELIAVKHYRKPSEVVDGYRISPRKAAFLNQASIKYGKDGKT